MSDPPGLHHLQRIIPVMETRELSRGQVTCVALEVYDDGAWINTWVEVRIDEAPETWPYLEIAACDDQGNYYVGWIGGGYGGGSNMRYGHLLSPAIAPDAGTLRLQVRARETGRGPFSRTEPIVWNHDLEETDPATDHATLRISLT